MKHILGIDIGGTGTKGAVVDVTKGTLVTDRIKYETPHPGTPQNILNTLKKIIKDLNWEGKPIGIGVPTIIKNGIAYTANNIDKQWIGYPMHEEFSKQLKVPISILNDADAAGLAEVHFGKLKDVKGTSMLITLGTGIGSALFLDGQLLPNVEVGSMRYRDGIAENYASNSARTKKDLSWKEWGKELNNVLQYIDQIINPNMIVLGGGVSKKFAKYESYLTLKTPIETATHLNTAGVIGAALAMAEIK